MAVDLVGKTFERWTVMEKHPEKKNGTTHWWCRCSCNNKRLVAQNNLLFGKSRSCGCLRNSLRKSQNWQVQLNLRSRKGDE